MMSSQWIQEFSIWDALPRVSDSVSDVSSFLEEYASHLAPPSPKFIVILELLRDPSSELHQFAARSYELNHAKHSRRDRA